LEVGISVVDEALGDDFADGFGDEAVGGDVHTEF